LAKQLRQFREHERRGSTAGITALSSAVGGAFLMAAAITIPTAHPWLGWLALAPLLRVIQVQAPRIALLSGVTWAAAILLFSRWLEHQPLVTHWLQVGAFCLLPGLFAYAAAQLRRQVGFCPLVVAVGWMAVELLLRPLGLQHGLLAVTQGDSLLVGVVGQAFGYVLVAFVLAFSSAALLSLLGALRFGPWQSYEWVGVAPKRAASPAPVRVLNHLHFIRPSRPRAPPW